MLVDSYCLSLFIQTHKKKVWTKVGQPMQGNEEMKVHCVPNPETRLDYPKLEKRSNWSMTVFSTVPTFLMVSFSPSSFPGMLAQWENHCLPRIVLIERDIVCEVFQALAFFSHPSLKQFHLSNSAACRWQSSVILHLQDLLHYHRLCFLPQDWSNEKKWVEFGGVWKDYNCWYLYNVS